MHALCETDETELQELCVVIALDACYNQSACDDELGFR